MDILHLPIDELAKLCMHNLTHYKTLQRASKSSLYHDKWATAGIIADQVQSYEDFSKIPYTTSREVRRAIYEQPLEELLCAKPIHWFSTTGTTGLSKWIPYGPRDVELFMQIRDRLYNMLPTKEGNLRLITVTAPPPYVEDGLALLQTLRGIQNKNGTQGVTISLTEADDEEVFDFGFSTKPNALFAFPSFAARLAEIVEESAPSVAKEQFAHKKTPKNLLLYLVTRVKKIKPSDLSKFRFGLFGGEPLDPYREVLKRMYGLEPYEMYVFTEFMPPTVECREHNGMHMWLDTCLPEIIPEEELDKERINGAYAPKAIPLWKTRHGQRGELVLTTFGEALPLVRYRFGDLIEVVSTDPCKCGYTHPRIKVPRRADLSTIALGGIRFPFIKLEEKVLTATSFGQAVRWQLQICREGYRPKLVIRVELDGTISNPEAFTKEIACKVLELEIIKTGCENKLLAEPEVKIEAALAGSKQVTKCGSVIFEGE